jgi:hypothetical protein
MSAICCLSGLETIKTIPPSKTDQRLIQMSEAMDRCDCSPVVSRAAGCEGFVLIGEESYHIKAKRPGAH